jgi:hypothetical protein
MKYLSSLKHIPKMSADLIAFSVPLNCCPCCIITGDCFALHLELILGIISQVIFPPKRWWSPTRPHDVTNQKTVTDFFTAVRKSDIKQQWVFSARVPHLSYT